MDARLKARRDRVTRARLRRRRRVTGSLAALVLLLLGAGGVAVSPLADITDVQLEGVDGDRRRQARTAADVRPGQNLLAVDLEAAGERVEALPWVDSAVAQRRPPSSVEITVVTRTPVAVVRSRDQAWRVDDEGVVVGPGGDDDLPVIEAPGADLAGAGARVRNEAVRNALAMRARLPEAIRSRVVRYRAPSPQGLRLELDSGVTAHAGRAERVGEKAEAIALLLERVVDAGGRPDAPAAAGEDAGGARVDAGDAREGAGVAREGAGDQPEAAGPGERSAVAEIDVRAPDRPVVRRASATP